MSNLGKIFLYVALVGALVAVGFGIALNGKYNDTKTSLTQTQAAKTAADAEAAKEKAAAEAAAQAQAQAEAKATAAATQVTDLTAKLTDAQKQADDAATALKQAKDAGDKAQADLTAINTQLNGQSVADIKAAQAKAQADLDASQSEKKILQDQLQGSLAQVEQLKVDINNSKTGKMPGVSGKVTYVNRTWNFVVLDVGLSNGVVPNGELIVYRKNAYLGKVKVTSAESNTAVADILPEVKGDIQIGDYVLN